MTEEMIQQRDTLQQKLESRRLMKETQDYEDLAAKTILKLAKEQHSKAVDNVKKEKRKQSSLVGGSFKDEIIEKYIVNPWYCV